MLFTFFLDASSKLYGVIMLSDTIELKIAQQAAAAFEVVINCLKSK